MLFSRFILRRFILVNERVAFKSARYASYTHFIRILAAVCLRKMIADFHGFVVENFKSLIPLFYPFSVALTRRFI